MKTLSMHLFTAPSLAAVILLSPLVAAAQQSPGKPRETATQPDKGGRSTDQKQSATSPANAQSATASTNPSVAASEEDSERAIHAAPKEAREQTVAKWLDKPVRGNGRKDLGEIKDLLVAPRSGEVVYAVVTSGGFAGIGDTLHLVPFKALKPDREDREAFMLTMDQAEWQQLGALGDEEFKAGRITLTDGERRRIAQQFARAESGPQATGSAFYTSGITSHLVRASAAVDKDVYVGGREVGTIESLVIDGATAQAVALFQPNRELGGADGSFLVPLSRFTFGNGDSDRITTMLSRSDFASGQDQSAVAAGGTPSSGGGPATGAGAARPRSTASGELQPKAADQGTRAAASSASPAPEGETSGTPKKDDDRERTATTTAQQSSQAASDTADSTKPNARRPAGSTTRTDEQLSATGRVGTTQPNASRADASGQSSPAGASGNTGARKQDERARTEVTNAQQTATPAKTATDARPTDAARPSSPTTRTDEELSPTGRNGAGQANAAATDGTGTSAATRDSAAGSNAATATQAEQGETASRGSEGKPHRGGDANARQSADDEQLTPTGRPGPDRIPAGADPATAGSADSVRKALEEELPDARNGIRVSAEGGKIVLRGKVKDENAKKEIEEKAREAAQGRPIVSQITIDKD